MVIPAPLSTVVRLLNAFCTCCPMSDVVGGDPSSPVAVWPEHSSTCDAPAISTACENPNAFDHSHGLTSVRSTGDSSIVTSGEPTTLVYAAPARSDTTEREVTELVRSPVRRRVVVVA